MNETEKQVYDAIIAATSIGVDFDFEKAAAVRDLQLAIALRQLNEFLPALFKKALSEMQKG